MKSVKNESEINRILQTYGDMLYRTAYLLLGNPHDVQDVLQEVLLRNMEKTPSFASCDHEKAWLLHYFEGYPIKEIAALGDELALIPDITYQYVSADEAWSYFKKTYLEGNSELSLSFTENPLADSFNYQISIRIGANTQEVRKQISHLEGVRKVTTIREWEKTTKASALY